MKETLGRETIIYGGAFNPPTRAHQAILQACVDYAEPRGADVWLLPSGERKDKEISETRDRRVELCEALIRDIMCRTVSVCLKTTELDRNKPSETYDTVCELNDLWPDRRFVWVFGADSVATMPEWHHGMWLQEQLDMLVVERPGYQVRNLGPRAVRLSVDAIETSSTELRRRVREGVSYGDIVSPSVGALLAQ